jgi:hypothetical protein
MFRVFVIAGLIQQKLALQKIIGQQAMFNPFGMK